MASGTLEAKGDITQAGSSGNLASTGTNKVILSGDDTQTDIQTISINTQGSGFNILDCTNSVGVYFQSPIKVTTKIYGLENILNDQIVTFVDSNIQLTGDTTIYCSLQLTNTKLGLNGHNLEIQGDLGVNNSTIDLSGGNLVLKLNEEDVENGNIVTNIRTNMQSFLDQASQYIQSAKQCIMDSNVVKEGTKLYDDIKSFDGSLSSVENIIKGAGKTLWEGGNLVIPVDDLMNDINNFELTANSIGQTALDATMVLPIAKIAKFAKPVLNPALKSIKIGERTGKEVSIIVKDVEKAKSLLNKEAKAACFTGETLILTRYGYKQIKDINVGDEVYSEDPQTGKQELKKVKKVFEHEKDELVKLNVGDNVIETTQEHPFWVEGKGWVAAKDLNKGDKLVSQDGKDVCVVGVSVEKVKEKIKVYNFEVEDFHTYFVSKNKVLVHNTCKQIAEGAAEAVKWKGFSKGELAEHFTKHGNEFGDITQNQYLKLAKDFAAESNSAFRETKVGNFIIKYDEATRRVLVGQEKSREIRTFYKADFRDADPFEAAVNLAKELSGIK